MKKYFYLLVLSLFLFSCKKDKEPTLQIATAANMQYAMNEIIARFEQKYGINCDLIVSSSGKLTAQIMEGAPYDVFVSADMKYPNTLFVNNFTSNSPKVYAHGNLVLWTNKLNNKPTLEILSTKNIKHIAIANPKTAPYGKAAVELLKHLNIYNKVESKLVYGESIAQTNQFIITGAAEVGFTAKAVVLAPNLKSKRNYIELDSKMYSPIKQGVVILKNGKSNPEYKKKFYTFLISKKGAEILPL